MVAGSCKNIKLDKAIIIDGYVEVGSDTDFEDGKGVCISISGKKIAMFKHGGRIGAIGNTCVHMEGPLADGRIEDDYVTCPFHGWSYDPFTGRAPHRFKGEDVPSYDVRVEDGKVFVALEPRGGEEIDIEEEMKPKGYLEEWARGYDEYEEQFYTLQQIIQHGRTDISAMGTLKKFPGWDTIVFKGAQLSPMPINEDVEVNTKTVIGKTAKQPLSIDIPFYVSHMSFGALSREAKIALAMGTSRVGTAMCSGEGGMLPESRAEASKYIYELGTAMFSHKDESVKKADAVEIKIGQAAKPGLGGHLPRSKITEEIASIRGITQDKDSISPARHADIDSLDDLKAEVDRLRELTGGKPIGIKFSAGHVEDDVRMALKAEPDFITVDSRGGGTGAAPTYIKDNVSQPAIFALHRARKVLDDQESEVTLCITGGFRHSSDIAKALAMGADAVALATFSLVGIGCQRYRTCHTGCCPVGIATQDPELRKRFDIERSVERFVRLYNITKEELINFARINGKADVHKLDKSDMMTLSDEVAKYTNVEHV